MELKYRQFGTLGRTFYKRVRSDSTNREYVWLYLLHTFGIILKKEHDKSKRGKEL